MRTHTFPLIASSYFFNLHSNVSWEDKRNKKLEVCIIIEEKEKKNDTSPRARNNNRIRSSKRFLPLKREWSSGLFSIVCIVN
jgi:hypothetical protein